MPHYHLSALYSYCRSISCVHQLLSTGQCSDVDSDCWCCSMCALAVPLSRRLLHPGFMDVRPYCRLSERRRRTTLRYDTIPDVSSHALESLLYCTEPTAKKWKTEKLRSKRRICSEVSSGLTIIFTPFPRQTFAKFRNNRLNSDRSETVK